MQTSNQSREQSTAPNDPHEDTHYMLLYLTDDPDLRRWYVTYSRNRSRLETHCKTMEVNGWLVQDAFRFPSKGAIINYLLDAEDSLDHRVMVQNIDEGMH